MFDGVKKGEGLFADLLKKLFLNKFPWLQEQLFKDFSKKAEEIARSKGLTPLTDLTDEESCNATGTYVWENGACVKIKVEPDPEPVDTDPEPEPVEECPVGQVREMTEYVVLQSQNQ